jgi:hypothetical protein
MPLKLFMDVHVPVAITSALAARGVDVLTAQQDGSQTLTDPQLLDRATELGRVLFSQDQDLLAEATHRHRLNLPFGGVIYAHPLRITIGRCIDDLELVAKVYEPEDMLNGELYLPL